MTATPPADAGLGDRVREARRRRGMSQTELAGDNLSPSYVSLVESGRRMPSAAVVEQLAARLGVSSSFLQTGQDDEFTVAARADLAFVAMAVDNGDAAVAQERGTALLERMGRDWTHRDHLVYQLARASELAGDLEKVCELLEPVSEKVRTGASELPLARVFALLSSAYLESGDVARAAEVAESGLTAAREHGWLADPEIVRLAATAVWAYLERGDALYASLRAQDFLSELGDGPSPASRGALLWNQALASNARGRHRLAMALMERANALMSEGSDQRDVPRASMAYAWLTLRAPEPDVKRAIGWLDDALLKLTRTGSQTDIAECEIELARAHLFRGDAERAHSLAGRALERLGPAQRLTAADAAALLGQAAIALGRNDEARSTLAIAKEHLLEVEINRSAGTAWAQLADAFAQVGDHEAAFHAARAAMGSVGLRTRWSAWPDTRQPSRPVSDRQRSHTR